jgi:hypothetical protein
MALTTSLPPLSRSSKALLTVSPTGVKSMATTYEGEDALRSLRVVEKLFELVEDVEDDVFPPR